VLEKRNELRVDDLLVGVRNQKDFKKLQDEALQRVGTGKGKVW
jgi:hypothetical protein